jgi:hypothetical protein
MELPSSYDLNVILSSVTFELKLSQITLMLKKSYIMYKWINHSKSVGTQIDALSRLSFIIPSAGI